ncbi:MAG TPA: NAD(P)-dependent oxidoreductase [Burkholderiales bacterium]|jgi:3-hydroxyisobutyrate dehydrogenase
MNIGFIGIGRMGSPMARFLLQGGYQLSVCDPNPEMVKKAVSHGATAAGSVAQCARLSDVVFSSLPDDKILGQTALGEASTGEAGIIASLKPGGIYVDTSTVSPAISTEIALAAGKRGVHYLRMPVSGNSNSAEAGELTALVSGPPEAWKLVEPMVKKFSTAQVYVGDAEQARYMKLVINLVVANTAGVLAEALALGRKGGLEWSTMLDGLAASTIGSPWVKAKARLLKTRDFTPTFTPNQLSKDLDLMLDAGDALGVPLQLTATTRQLMKATNADGYAAEDFIAVVKVVERLSGLPTDKA